MLAAINLMHQQFINLLCTFIQYARLPFGECRGSHNKPQALILLFSLLLQTGEVITSQLMLFITLFDENAETLFKYLSILIAHIA